MNIYYFISAIVCNTLFRFHPFCFQFGIPEENHTSFAVGQALSWILLLLAFRDKKFSRIEQSLFCIGFWCGVSNLMDELFFDPLHFGWNEKFFAIFIVGNEVIRYYMNRKNNEQCTG